MKLISKIVLFVMLVSLIPVGGAFAATGDLTITTFAPYVGTSSIKVSGTLASAVAGTQKDFVVTIEAPTAPTPNGKAAALVIYQSVISTTITETGKFSFNLQDQNGKNVGFNTPYVNTKEKYWLNITDVASGDFAAMDFVFKQSSGGGSGGGGGSYNPGSTVTTAPSGEPASSDIPTVTADPNAPFTDLASVEWAAGEINKLKGLGVVTGMDAANTKFEPGSPVTRSQFATMVVRLFSIPTAGATSQFTDVSTNDWFYPYVSAGVSDGFIQGYGDGRFGPEDEITREQIAAMLYRVLSKRDAKFMTGIMSFSDASFVSDWARDAVAGLSDAEIIKGYNDGTFGPTRNATRAEAASMLGRVHSKYVFVDPAHANAADPEETAE